MQTLTCKVDGQTLTGVDLPPKLQSNSIDQYKLRFDISGTNWNGRKLIVEFNDSYAMPVQNYICAIPNDCGASSIIKIRLYGFGKNNSKIMTNSIYVEQGV